MKNKFKKTTAIVMALLMLVMTVPTGVFAKEKAAEAELVIGNYTYSINADNASVTITKYDRTATETDITVPATLSDLSVTAIGEKAFLESPNLKTVTLPETIKTIGGEAFRSCTNLTKITIPKAVETIGESVFAYCTLLEKIDVEDANPNYCDQDGVLFKKNESNVLSEIMRYPGRKTGTNYVIPDTVTSIATGAFMYSSFLETIDISEKVTSIGDNAFESCTKLTTLTIPTTVTRIGMAAFFSCTNLRSLIIPKGVTTIEANTFYSCSSLTTLTIPETVTTIKAYAFFQCSSLTTLTIPKTVTSIGVNALGSCSQLERINVAEGNPNYCDQDGVLFNQNSSQIICYPEGKTGTSYAIPNTVTSIEDSAFNGCEKLISITIPKGVTTIGASAFAYCTNLTEIAIPTTVTSIGASAFIFCENLTSIAIPTGVTIIEENTFQSCANLTNVTIPEGVTTIKYAAFHDCNELTGIIIPTTVTKIEEEVFSERSENNLIIYGEKGSFAESYANINTIKFQTGSEAMQEAFEKANTVKEGVVISNKEASLVNKGIKFVTSEEMQALTTAIEKAKKESPTTIQDSVSVAIELNTATSIFEQAIKTGTYLFSPDPTPNPTPNPTPDPTPSPGIDSEKAVDEIQKAPEGSTVTIPVKDVAVPKDIFEAAKGKDITLVLEYSDTKAVYHWSIDCKTMKDIPEGVDSYDLTVKIIKDETLSALINHSDSLQLEIKHSGALPFMGTLTYPVSPAFNGKTLHLFYYNEPLKRIEYQGNSVVSNAQVAFKFDHASKYVLSETAPEPENSTAFAKYQTHISEDGWQAWVEKGALSGTTGEAKALEGIKIEMSDQENIGIEYKTHSQDIGWETTFKKDGEVSGTSGKAKRLEAIQMKLRGKDAAKYDLYYQVHAQNYGWLDWAKNGESAGTSGQSLRLEAIKIVVVPKGEKAPGKTTRPFIDGSTLTKNVMASYSTHVENLGWQDPVNSGMISGSSGEALRLEGIKIKTDNPNLSIDYRTHIQDMGWEADWKSNAVISGTTGEAKRLEAIEIKLSGKDATKYDVYYQVHAEDYAWMNWVKNGEVAGTTGESKRLEAIKIIVLKKGSPAPTLTK